MRIEQLKNIRDKLIDIGFKYGLDPADHRFLIRLCPLIEEMTLRLEAKEIFKQIVGRK